jgi:hypothetical protein
MMTRRFSAGGSCTIQAANKRGALSIKGNARKAKVALNTWWPVRSRGIGRKPSLANFRVFGCPVYFKHYELTFCNKLITYKQQLQRASHGIFIGFPENSDGWLVYSPEHPQCIVITSDFF